MTKKEEVAEESVAEMQGYEVMLILKPTLLEAAVGKKLKEFDEFIKSAGKVTAQDNWGKRRLAYRIKQCDEGVYVVYNIEIPPSFTKEVNQHLQIDPEVIRHLIMAIPEGYIYTKFSEEPDQEEEKPARKAPSAVKPRAAIKKKEVKPAEAPKDEGIAPSPEALDAKLNKLLEGEDLNI
ncbi:30S ribosomal protein S6 [Candidatus Peregrinibacteria bacterium]|nr:30S ribosomal protein S6 [Candidatus Peregrinibacteria bacterium]